MEPLRISVATATFAQPLKQAIETAATFGVQGVQFDVRNELKSSDFSQSGRRQLVHLLAERGLRVASVRFPTRRTLYDLEGLDARVAALKNAMQFAAQLEARILTLRVGKIPSDESSLESQRLLTTVNDLASHANHVGVSLAITPMRDSLQSLQSLFAQTTDGPVGLDLDAAGFVTAGHQPLDVLQVLHKMVLHVEVRDAVRDLEGSVIEVPVGRGDVEWPAVLALLDHAAYKGWYHIQQGQGDDRIQDAARTVQFLRQVAVG